MKLFPYAHATHPQWRVAAALVLAQLRARLAQPDYASAPTLALLYITDYYAADAQEILDHLSAELPEVTDWSGTVGVGVLSNNTEYFDEPALAVMLCELAHDQYRVFSGVAPLPSAHSGLFQAHTALVHADAATPDLAELIEEMASRTDSGYVFGGLASSRTRSLQFALSGHGNVKGQGAAGGVFSGGLSGVAFARDPGGAVGLMSRVTQGCRPVAAAHEITACDGHVITALDGKPALEVMLADLGIGTQALAHPSASRLEAVLVGLSPPAPRHEARPSARQTGQFGAEVVVRHLIGLDPANSGIAIADLPRVGMRLTFCERNAQAAKVDLVRICTEIRAALEPEALTLETASALNPSPAQAPPPPARRMAGAVYVSCSGRGGPHFGAPGAELQIVRRALGDVPLVGFFAGGEIARNRLYGYTGVLTVFTLPD